MRLPSRPLWPLLGLIGVVGVIVIVANSASDPLVSVSVSDQDLTLSCRRNIRQAISDLTGIDTAAFAGRTAILVVDEIPELVGKPADADLDASVVLDQLESGEASSGNWIVAHKTKQRMVLTSTGGGLILAKRTGDDWQVRRQYHEAPCGVRSEGNPLPWVPARTVKSTDTQLEVLVADRCGDQVVAAFSAVTIGEDSVIVTISGDYPRDNDDLGCTKTSGRKVVVDIGEPIGARDLFNGSDFPPQRVKREVSGDPWESGES